MQGDLQFTKKCKSLDALICRYPPLNLHALSFRSSFFFSGFADDLRGQTHGTFLHIWKSTQGLLSLCGTANKDTRYSDGFFDTVKKNVRTEDESFSAFSFDKLTNHVTILGWKSKARTIQININSRVLLKNFSSNGRAVVLECCKDSKISQGPKS